MSKKIILLSTAPPMSCGIATFSEHVLQAFNQVWDSDQIKIERVPVADKDNDNEVFNTYELVIEKNKVKSYMSVASTLNKDKDVIAVLLQHEFGIFGGVDGGHICKFVSELQKPLYTTLHTVLEKPTDSQKKVVQTLADSSFKISTMIHSSAKLLSENYGIDNSKIEIIPHGIPYVSFKQTTEPRKQLGLPVSAKIATTFGLLGPGKGIEFAIQAIAANLEKHPNLHYLIIGATHPNVVKSSGEKYRDGLKSLAKELKAENHIHFIDKFVEETELLSWIQAGDLYICPPQNPQQASSGTLAYALGSGRAVVATRFKHAVDVINNDNGALAEISEFKELAEKIDLLLSNPIHLYRMGKNAYYNTRDWLWHNVVIQLGQQFKDQLIKVDTVSNLTSDQIQELFQLSLPSPNLTPLLQRTDEIGLWQFGQHDIDDIIYGYTLDDNARAAIAVNNVTKYFPETLQSFQALSLLEIYINFIINAFDDNYNVHNYYDHSYLPDYDLNSSENLLDARSRGVWAIGEVINNQTLPLSIINSCRKFFNTYLGSEALLPAEPSLRAASFSGLGILGYLQSDHVESKQVAALEKALDNRLRFITKELLKHTNGSDWVWYEPIISYANGIISQFHLQALEYFNNGDKQQSFDDALAALDFLYKNSINNNIPSPVGQDGWLKKDSDKATYDQQPEEPAHLVLACLIAYQVTKKDKWLERANNMQRWFYGNNLQKVEVYNRETGAVYDGLTKTGVNLNQGAESLVIHLIALTKLIASNNY